MASVNKVIPIGNGGRFHPLEAQLDSYVRAVQRTRLYPEAESLDWSQVRDIAAALDVEDPQLLQEMLDHMIWRCQLQAICSNSPEIFSCLDELGVKVWEALEAIAEEVFPQPVPSCIRWPRLTPPAFLGPRKDSKTCHRKPSGGFFSASKTNLRNAP